MFRLLRSNHIEIDLLKRRLYFYQAGNLFGSYPVAIGKPSTPSPVGEWTIINKKILNYPSIFGTRWMGLSNPGYGIHGTNNPSSIGKAVSLGCIRMYNHDIESIFPLVSLGTKVIIYKGSSTLNNTNNPEKPDNKSYVIKPGDTLWSISKKLNIPLQDILKANPNLNPNNLQIGQKIFLT